MKSIPLFKVYMHEEAHKKVEEVLRSGFIGQGPRVEEFEARLKERFGIDYLVTTNSATSAEHLALHLLKKANKDTGWPGIDKHGYEEVLATPLTCTASNWPILANNMLIKWVDVDPETLNMDLDDLARKITDNTKAIMLVHWGGYPNDLDKIKSIQERSKEIFGFKPAVIEDAAHAMGSKYKGKYIGRHGNLTTYSFQAIKHFTTGDGGMLILPHMELYKRAKLLRWYGIDRDSDRKDFRCEADVVEWGFKFHMNDISAAIGLANFDAIDVLTALHRSNAYYYDEALKGISGLKTLKREQGFDSSFWIYSLLVEDRENFTKAMKDRGVAVSQVHERNDKHTCVKEFRSHLPNLEKVIGKLTHIPVGWWVTEEDRQHIVDSIRKGW